MAIFVTHGIFASTLTFLWRDKKTKFSVFLLIFVASILPDIDFIFQEESSKMFSHRGITHSLFFAAMTGAAFSALFLSVVKTFNQSLLLMLIFFLASASHGVLDAMTESAYGVCFYCPFSDERFFFPFTPFSAYTAGVAHRGFRPGLGNSPWVSIFPEILWVWMPAFAFFIISSYLKAKNPDNSGGRRVNSYKPVEIKPKTKSKPITRSSTHRKK